MLNDGYQNKLSFTKIYYETGQSLLPFPVQRGNKEPYVTTEHLETWLL